MVPRTHELGAQKSRRNHGNHRSRHRGGGCTLPDGIIQSDGRRDAPVSPTPLLKNPQQSRFGGCQNHSRMDSAPQRASQYPRDCHEYQKSQCDWPNSADLPRTRATSLGCDQTFAHDDYGRAQCRQVHIDERAAEKTRGQCR